jgi:hypothetical protein
MPCQLFRLRDYETEIGVCFNFAVKFPILPPPGGANRRRSALKVKRYFAPRAGKSKLEIDGTEKSP